MAELGERRDQMGDGCFPASSSSHCLGGPSSMSACRRVGFVEVSTKTRRGLRENNCQNRGAVECNSIIKNNFNAS